MGFNFPDSPTPGQVFPAPGGPTWNYSSGAWVQSVAVEPSLSETQFFNSMAQAMVSTIDAEVQLVTLLGYYEPSEFGGARYKKVLSAPTKPGKFQSADGAWWKIAEPIVTPQMFGATMDYVTGTPADSWQAFQNAIDYIPAGPYGDTQPGGDIYVPSGFYYCSQTLILKARTRIMGQGGGFGDFFPRITFAPDTGGFIINTHDTLGDVIISPTTTTGAGSTIQGLELRGSGTDTTKHGVWMRGRAFLKNLSIYRFSGNGVYIRADSQTSTPAQRGNANCWRMDTVTISRCNLNGVELDGGDVNAGSSTGLSLTYNGRFGIKEGSFLGNTHINVHTAYNGLWSSGNDEGGNRVGTKSSVVTYGGNRYYATTTATEAQLVATVPGTDESIWTFYGVGGVHSDYYPLWVAAQPVGTYFAGGSYYSDNLNGRNVWVGCYSESGQAPARLSNNNLRVGGLMGGGGGMQLTDGTFIAENIYAREQITVSAGLSEFVGLLLHNTASFGGVRTSAINFACDVNPDGTPRLTGALRFSPISSTMATDRSAIVLQYFDGPADSLISAMLWRGQTKEAHPGADNTWSLGRFAERWLKGWFGNISLFPAASVTPANNGEMTFQLTSNTSLAIKVKGSDGIVRSGSVALA